VEREEVRDRSDRPEVLVHAQVGGEFTPAILNGEQKLRVEQSD
jgi:hypothetical protein